MEIPTTKYLADYLYVVHEDVPFRYYRKVSFPNEISIWIRRFHIVGRWISLGICGQ